MNEQDHKPTFKWDFWETMHNQLVQYYTEPQVNQWLDHMSDFYENIKYDPSSWPEGEADFKRFTVKLVRVMTNGKIRDSR